jgi:hypothetical protein
MLRSLALAVTFGLGLSACQEPPPPPPVRYHFQSTFTERCLASTPTGLATVQCTMTGEQLLEVRMAPSQQSLTLCFVGSATCLSDLSALYDVGAQQIHVREGADYRCLAIRSTRGDTTLETCNPAAHNQRWIVL